MSKRKLDKRIEEFFAGFDPGQIEGEEGVAPASTPVFAWQTDANGLFVACDPAVTDVLGYTPSQVEGQPFLSFALSNESQNQLREALLKAQFPIELEVQMIGAENTVKQARYSIFEMRDESGTVMGYRGYCESTSPEFLSRDGDRESAIAPVLPVLKKRTRKTSESKKLQTRNLATDNLNTSPLETDDLQVQIPEKNAARKNQQKTIADGTKKLKERSKNTRSHSRSSDEPQHEPVVPIETSSKALTGIALVKNHYAVSNSVWTAQAQASFDADTMIAMPSVEGSPAVLAIPLKLRDEKSGIIEIVDDTPGKTWSEDDRKYLQEVTHQLSLALENSQLYSTIQRELSERVRAEREALLRNKDLANLNQFGQKLGQLAGEEQIFQTIASEIQQLLSVKNLLLTLQDSNTGELRFPVCVLNGVATSLPPRMPAKGYNESVLQSHQPLLINKNLSASLQGQKFDHSTYMPYSLLAVPLSVGGKADGVLSIFDYQNEDAFNPSQVEMLSSAASQVATALENASLFNDVNHALRNIEKRQHLQSNVTKAIYEISQEGAGNPLHFLQSLQQAANCDRVLYLEHESAGQDDETWRIHHSITSPDSDLPNKSEIDDTFSIDQTAKWEKTLKTKGWHSFDINTILQTEKALLGKHAVNSILLLHVTTQDRSGGVIALERVNPTAEWNQEEIDILRMASEAFCTALEREDLLEKLRASLNETEILYSASHQMALATNLQEMITTVISSFSDRKFDNGEIILFNYSLQGRVTKLTCLASAGKDTLCKSGAFEAESCVEILGTFLSGMEAQYIDDLTNADLSPQLAEFFANAHIQSLAVLPIWNSSVQIGVLLLHSDHPHLFSDLEKRFYPPLVDQMSTAIQNLQLFESTQIALAETELLYRISNGIANVGNLEELVVLVGQNALPLECDTLSLYCLPGNQVQENSDFILSGVFSKNEGNAFSSPRIPASALPCLDFLSTEAVIIGQTTQDEHPCIYQTIFKNSGIQKVILFPLLTSTNPVGFLLVTSTSEFDVPQKGIRTLQIICSSIAVAIERQRLLADAQRRALELQTASEVARDTTSTLSQDILLNRIVNLLQDRFGYHHCSIFLLDDTNQFAVIEEGTGEAGKLLKQQGYRFAVGSKTVIGSCLASGQAVIINDTELSPIYREHPLLVETRSEIAIPLKIGGRIIGALDIHSTQTNNFSENEFTVLQILTDQISIGIENARAFAVSQKAVQEMRELDRVKSQFLANMSHELRTPLNSVIGFSRVILKGIDGPINKVQEQDITSIYNSGMSLLNMINEILDLSKIEAGKMELQIEDINITDVINKSVSTAMGLIKDKPVELETVVPPDLPLVKGDALKLGQVILNLLSNAIKFTDRGVVTLRAELIHAAEQNPELRVVVTDSGLGIAEIDQAKLFQRFSQVDDSPTRKTGGTGLGLSISRSLIEMHGGRIGLLESTPGKGSSFYFTLPLAAYRKGIDITRLGHGENVILSIDDDPQVIALYERYLKNYGFEVVAVSNPEKALEKAIELKPFAITLDIMMPQMDGWQVLSELKQDERTHDIPILVCSILEDAEKGFNLGASDYLVKPFLQGDLIKAIHRIHKDNQTLEVLVIDDDLEDLKFVKKMVEAEPSFHPTLAQGGDQALKILENLTPDLIILDLFMPDMNGFELLDKFKSDTRLENVPVILLTGTELTSEQKRQLMESSKSLAANSLLQESDILKNLEEALEKIKQLK